jgi:hypothetical protein
MNDQIGTADFRGVRLTPFRIHMWQIATHG